MGIAIILLGFPLSILAWVLIARKLKQKSYSGLSRHLAGFAGSFVVWWLCAIVGAIASPEMMAEANAKAEQDKKAQALQSQTASAVVSSEPVAKPEPVAEASEPIAVKQDPLLNLSLDDYIKQLNATFAKAGSEHKVSKNLKIDAGKVNDTANFTLSDNVSAVLSLRKDTRELQSVLAIWLPKPDKSDNITDLLAISAIASAVDGSDSMKSVGGKVIQKISALMEKWSKDQENAHTDEFVLNNVTYTINVSSVTGVMVSIEPTK